VLAPSNLLERLRCQPPAAEPRTPFLWFSGDEGTAARRTHRMREWLRVYGGLSLEGYRWRDKRVDMSGIHTTQCVPHDANHH
jgi:hypothetical protein